MNTLYGTISGVLTGLLILLFTSVVIWAWSSRRRESFEASARLPLEEDLHINPSPDRERLP
jgi:cytochrome c oxidase cbb3-type subunit IV